MEELNIGTIFNRIRQGWRTPAIFAAVLAMFSLTTLIGAQPVYRVSMTIMPAPSDQGAQTMNSSGTLSTLLGLGTGGNVNYSRYQKLLGSTAVAQRLQDKYGMLQYVFRPYWDAEHKVWIPPPKTMRNYLLDWLLKLSNVPTWTPPDINALAAYLDGRLTLLPSPNSDIVSVTMDGPDVAFSKRVMLAAHEQANEVLRDQIARRARLQAAYLQSKLAETSVQDYRATLLLMLGNQEKTLMFAQTDASYAAEILSPPTASSKPISPRPVLTLFVAMMVGALVGLAVVTFFGPHWWRRPYERMRNFRRRRNGESLPART